MTDTAGVSLASHTVGTGGPWVIITDGGGNGEALISDANRVRPNTLGVNTGSVAYVPTATPSSADYSVEADFRCVTNSAILYLMIRAVGASGNVFNGYGLQYRTFFGWRLFVISASGTGTQIGSDYAVDMGDASTVHAKIDVSGSNFTVTLDGVSRITGSDSTYSAAGTPAMMFTTTATNSTGVHLDNVTATNGAAAASSPRGTLVGVGP